MNPEDFLDSAQLLLSNYRESNHRSCISRAYYAVYHILRIPILAQVPLALLQSSGVGSKNHISHDKLPNALKNSSEPAIRRFGEQLENLKLARTNADYNLDKRTTHAAASEHFQNADKLRNDIKSFGISRLIALLETDLRKTFGTMPKS